MSTTYKLNVLAIGALMAGALLISVLPALAAEDLAEAGEKVFKKCAACHKIGEGAKNSVGPVLNGVVNRESGTFEGYAYSTLNSSAGANGLTWSQENLLEYLTDPTGFLKTFLTDKGKPELAVGSAKMPFKLLPKDEREAVVAYLTTLAPAK